MSAFVANDDSGVKSVKCGTVVGCPYRVTDLYAGMLVS